MGAKLVAQQPRRTTTFLSGRIVAVTPTAIQVISSTGPATLYLYSYPRKSDIWKRRSNALAELRPGDFFYATLEPDAEGRLWIQKLLANIVNYFGLISALKPDGFDLTPYQGDVAARYSVRVRVDADTIHDNGNGSPNDIRQGLFAQVVGVIQPDGTVLASRMWVYTD